MSGRNSAFGILVRLALPAMLAGSLPAPTALSAAAASRQLELRIPLPGTEIQMRTRVVRPTAAGRYRLAVISHGSEEDVQARQRHTVPAYRALVSLLLERGYVVAVPQRPGHGETGGPYLEAAGSCGDPDFVAAGNATAASIRATIEFMMRQSYVRAGRAVLIGHSAGAWGSLALSSRFPDLVEGVIGFSGGRGGRSYGVANSNCAPERLVKAAGDFGRTTRVPTLWLYSRNDSYFGPDLAAKMADAFRASGGAVELHMLPAIGEDGHFMIELPEAVPLWRPIVDRFLRRNRSQR